MPQHRKALPFSIRSHWQQRIFSIYCNCFALWFFCSTLCTALPRSGSLTCLLVGVCQLNAWPESAFALRCSSILVNLVFIPFIWFLLYLFALIVFTCFFFTGISGCHSKRKHSAFHSYFFLSFSAHWKSTKVNINKAENSTKSPTGSYLHRLPF